VGRPPLTDGVPAASLLDGWMCVFLGVWQGKGGRTVYLGPTAEALPYFEGHGIVCPPLVNPPDFMMDVISGQVPDGYRAAHPDFTADSLFGMWTGSAQVD
jgi:hypothetical protein